MKGTGAKRNVCPDSCESTGAKFPVVPVESAPMCTTTVQGQKVKGKGHKVTHKKFTESRALALVTLDSKRPLIVVVAQ